MKLLSNKPCSYTLCKKMHFNIAIDFEVYLPHFASKGHAKTQQNCNDAQLFVIVHITISPAYRI